MSAHLAALGQNRFRQLAEICYHKAHYAANRIAGLDGYQVVGTKPFLKEFVVRCPAPVGAINDYLLEEWGIIGGYDLGRDYASLANHMLVCVTEVIRREEIDVLVEALDVVAREVAS